MPATDRPLPSFEHERDALVGAAMEAASAILPLWRDRSVKVWTKGDDSPVSEADMRANAILQEVLHSGVRSHYGWLSEESADDQSRFSAQRTIIVDPIDGTRAFLEGKDCFTVCLAVTEGEQVVASVVYAPAREEIYAAARGAGATLNGEPISASQTETLAGSRMIGQRRMFEHPAWPEPWPSMDIHYRNSTAFRMASVARGQFDGTLALVPKADWDAGPGSLIAEEAGARIGDHHGQSFRFNQPAGEQRALVCAAAPLYPQLIRRLEHLPGNLRAIQT